jgi:hypothetical protein
MSEDPLDYGRLLDQPDQAQTAAAPRTGLPRHDERRRRAVGVLAPDLPDQPDDARGMGSARRGSAIVEILRDTKPGLPAYFQDVTR